MRADEPIEVRPGEALLRLAPCFAVGLQLVDHAVDPLALLVELVQGARAEDPESGGDAIEPPNVGLPRLPIPPRLREELVDDVRQLAVLGIGDAAEHVLEVDVRASQRHVGRRVGHQHLVVRGVEATGGGERLDEVERMSDVLPPAVLRIAAVGLPIGGRRVVAADVPRRAIGPGGRGRDPGERARVALRHHGDDPHAGIEKREQRVELLHREALVLPPQDDAVVRGVVGVLRSVVRDVEEEDVAGREALPLVLEPRREVRLRGRPDRDVAEPRVDVLDGRTQRQLEPRPVDEPEVRRLGVVP